MRLRAHQRAFRSPFGNLRVGAYCLVFLFSPNGRGRGDAPAGARGCACGRKGMRLRAHQRAFRSPFGNLRVSPSYTVGARRVALDVQESRPALLRQLSVGVESVGAVAPTDKPVRLRATLRAPACLGFRRQGGERCRQACKGFARAPRLVTVVMPCLSLASKNGGNLLPTARA